MSQTFTSFGDLYKATHPYHDKPRFELTAEDLEAAKEGAAIRKHHQSVNARKRRKNNRTMPRPR